MDQQTMQAHGGELVDLLAAPERAKELQALSRDWPSWDLTPRQLCDVELLLNGGFSPLTGFLGQGDYESVCKDMRLTDGTLWPLPICLDVPESVAESLQPGASLVLRDLEGVMLAVLTVTDIWQPDRRREAEQVFGTSDPQHLGAAFLLRSTHTCYVGGKLEGVQLPAHYDFRSLRQTPRELRSQFATWGWRAVLAVQTRTPMHRPHYELLRKATTDLEANLLLHPVVGMTSPGDVDHHTRVRCCQGFLRHFPHGTAMLSLLPLAMRMGGPPEAVLHAIVRRNYGCSHLMVWRDHASPGNDSTGRPFCEPFEAYRLVQSFEEELGIRAVPSQALVYVPDRDQYVPEDEVPEGATALTLSREEVHERLADGREIPAWFSFPEVISELRRRYPARSKQGFTVFFTGLPSSGKSTLAKVLLERLLEIGGRPLTLLDGDVVRKHLSSELGFSREHRDLNIRRIGFVASEITKNGGIALCAPIAPYARIRQEVREMVSAGGGFILVHVATPLEVCEQRDRKGLYAKARAGIVKEFTGISDPYEVPEDADLQIDTTEMTPEECVQSVVLHLEKLGYLGGDAAPGAGDAPGA